MNDLLEQDLLDLQDAKEVALSPRYLIRNSAQNDRYWSRGEGWTDYTSADTFLPDDVGHFELPTDGQWVPIEEACLIKIEPEQDLKEMLTTGFESLLQSSLETKGFLVEQEWHVGGKSRGKFFFSGPALVVRAVMNQIDSARIQAGEAVEDNVFSTARHLKETISGLLLESSRQFVKIWAECPRLDQWNGTWIFESVLVAADKSVNEEGSEGDDFKDIYGPGLPGAFAVPKGLGPEGQKAWEIIVDVLSSEGVRNAGITERVFYGPDEQSIADPDCDLAIYHPGDSLRRFFVPDYGAILPFTKMKSALNKAGFVVESLSDWSVIYHQPLSEEQLVLIGKCLVEGIEDDELAAKDVMAIGCTDQITQAVESAGLVMAGAAPANQNFWPGRIIVTAYAPDEMDWHDKDTFLARQKATSYAEEAEQRIKKALAMPPMPRFSYTVFFEMKQGRWFFHFWVPDQAPVAEALGAAEPVFTKEQHIQQFFMSNGLHIESMMEEPADPALGEAGQPGRIIRSVLQPDGDKPWTTAGVAGPELLNFLRHIKSELGETLETADIEYRTRFRQDLGAWRITWLIGNPVIHEAAEQSDVELSKEVLPVGDFYPGVLVFRRAKPERIGRITKQVPYNHRDKIETTWMVDWGPSLYLEPAHQSDLEVAPVKPAKTNEALNDDFETELAKEVGPVPPSRMKMPSGLEGWQDYLQNVYGDFEEFERYSETYGLAQRLGFESAEAAWAANPLIHGSVQSSDYGTAQESAVSDLVDRLAEGEELTEHTEEGDDDRVGVVGVFRKNGDGYQVLVARREVDPQAGTWCLPGGHAQVGEDILDGTKREMKEETHLDLDDLTFIKKIRNEERDAYVYVYGAMLPDGDRAKAGDDAEKIKWVPIDDLPDLAFDNNKLVKEIADKMELDVEPAKEPAMQESLAELSIDQLIAYHKSIAEKLDAAQREAVAQETDPREKEALTQGHGRYLGKCGHVIKQCRCGPHRPIMVDAPCQKCSHNDRQESFAESGVKSDKGMYIEPGIPAEVLKIIQAETDTARKRGTHQGCEERSFIWAQIFDEAGFRDRIKVVYGEYAGEPAVPTRHDPHVYLRIDGKVFDPTAWQYQDYPTMDPAKYVDSKHVVEAHESGQIKLAESIDARFERMIGEDKAKNRYGKDGFLAVFEGIDGSGKTTNIERLADWLNEKDYSYVTTKWASSKALHDALWKAKCKKRLTPMSFSLIHASDMHIRYENIIVPALKKGKVVICDRYYFTSYVRDKIRGIDEELLDMVYEGFRKPDLIFFLHVPVRIAVERLMADRGVGYYSSGQDVGYGIKGVERTTERYEKDMQDRYEKLFKNQSNVVRLDAARPLKEIAKDIKHEIRKHLGLKENSD